MEFVFEATHTAAEPTDRGLSPSRAPGLPNNHPKKYTQPETETEKLWTVEKWKSKTGIPTFPPPRIACGARKKPADCRNFLLPPIAFRFQPSRPRIRANESPSETSHNNQERSPLPASPSIHPFRLILRLENAHRSFGLT